MPIVRNNGKSVYFPPDATQDEMQRALALNKGEESLLNYHRSNLEDPLVNEDGSMTTVWITGVNVGDEVYAIPGYDRDARRKMTPQEAAAKWLPSIRQDPNIFPHHKSGEEHNKWAQEFHKIIESTTE